ncbi:MAG TPA: nuclear transport factor 2 family protein [Solirubrobacteraceae bacterium]|jgi:ketosteroid isomerase-like protein|nr:nuclear transport factor 2 family protein [Solirubrobacteraceae bacterium]
MSARHPHADLILEFHDRQNRFYGGGEQRPVAAMLTDDVVWHVPGRSAIAGDYRGRDEVLAYFARRRDLANATFRIDVRGVLSDDERTVILAGGEVESGGKAVSWGTVGIFRIADCAIAECWVVPYDQPAFDAIWSFASGLNVRER